MTLSDLLYLCALFAVIAGVALIVAVFFGILAAVGAGLIAASACLYRSARAFDRDTS